MYHPSTHDSYLKTSPLIGRGPRAWPGRRGAPFPSTLGPSASDFPGFRPFRLSHFALLGPSASGFHALSKRRSDLDPSDLPAACSGGRNRGADIHTCRGAARFRSSGIFQQFFLPHPFAGYQKTPQMARWRATFCRDIGLHPYSRQPQVHKY